MEQVSRSINLRGINLQKSISDFQRSLQMNPALSQMVQSGKFIAGSRRFANMAPQYMSQVFKPRDFSKAEMNFNSKHGHNLNLPELGSVDEDEDVVKMESRGGSRIKEKGLGINDSVFIDYQPKNNDNEEDRASVTNFSEMDLTQRVNESLQSMQLYRPLQSGLPQVKEDSPIRTIQQILDSPKRLSAYKSSMPLSNNRPFEAISEESRESKDRPDKKNEFKIQVAIADPASSRSYLPNTNTANDSSKLQKLGQGNVHGRKEADEEYFHLAVISYLLQHQKRGYLFNVDKGILFRQARSQNIAFTEWPKWIERQMINIHNEKQRKKKAQQQP